MVELRDVVDADLPILFAYQAEPEGNAMAAFPLATKPAFHEHMAKISREPCESAAHDRGRRAGRGLDLELGRGGRA